MIRPLFFTWLFIFFQTAFIASLHHTILSEQVAIFKEGLAIANAVLVVGFIYYRVFEGKGL